jgi:hypothetical protein
MPKRRRIELLETLDDAGHTAEEAEVARLIRADIAESQRLTFAAMERDVLRDMGRRFGPTTEAPADAP